MFLFTNDCPGFTEVPVSSAQIILAHCREKRTDSMGHSGLGFPAERHYLHTHNAHEKFYILFTYKFLQWSCLDVTFFFCCETVVVPFPKTI